MTALTQAVHHGMIYVPPGYTFGGPMFTLDEVKGGSPWGAGTFAGADGSRQPSETELGYATHQGEYFAGKVLKLAAM
jgi:NAD(P)H dehydrogenase (quinone)